MSLEEWNAIEKKVIGMKNPTLVARKRITKSRRGDKVVETKEWVDLGVQREIEEFVWTHLGELKDQNSLLNQADPTSGTRFSTANSGIKVTPKMMLVSSEKKVKKSRKQVKKDNTLVNLLNQKARKNTAESPSGCTSPTQEIEMSGSSDQKADTDYTGICEHCRSSDIIFDSREGYQLCERCGYVQSDYKIQSDKINRYVIKDHQKEKQNDYEFTEYFETWLKYAEGDIPCHDVQLRDKVVLYLSHRGVKPQDISNLNIHRFMSIVEKMDFTHDKMECIVDLHYQITGVPPRKMDLEEKPALRRKFKQYIDFVVPKLTSSQKLGSGKKRSNVPSYSFTIRMLVLMTCKDADYWLPFFKFLKCTQNNIPVAKTCIEFCEHYGFTPPSVLNDSMLSTLSI
jgi:hypothetical protein